MSAISKRKVLVLNKSWTAIGVSSLYKAITLLFNYYENGEPKAKIITPPPKGSYESWTWEDWAMLKPQQGEDGIVSSTEVFKIPEVILLTRYDSVPKQKVSFCRKAIWKRDQYTCQYCGKKPGPDECTIDHVVPRCRGGETTWDNCVLACFRCNSQKADRKPEEAFKTKERINWIGPSPMKLLKQPVKPGYSIFRSADRIKVLDTWKHWVDKLYWEIPLDNDMDSDDEDDFDLNV